MVWHIGTVLFGKEEFDQAARWCTVLHALQSVIANSSCSFRTSLHCPRRWQHRLTIESVNSLEYDRLC